MTSDREHWNRIFMTTEDSRLGWYEKDTAQTFSLLDKIPGIEKSTVFISGAGTSILAEDLLAKVQKIVLNDISDEALDRVRNRLKGHSEKMTFLCQDISRPIDTPLPGIDIWVDRAVLHFLTDEKDIRGYFVNLKSILKKGGHALFAEFSRQGASTCAGLLLHRYSVEELSENLGPAFELVSQSDYIHTTPGGDRRAYIYALFKRTSP